MHMKRLLDPNPGLRSEAQWRQLLGGLVESLSAFTCITFEPTSWSVQGDQPGFASACNAVNVRGEVSSTLRLEACGVVCVTVNFGEVAWASCNLLLFTAGQRVRGPEGLDLVFLSFGPLGWVGKGWVVDDTGEWESHTMNEWWRRA